MRVLVNASANNTDPKQMQALICNDNLPKRTTKKEKLGTNEKVGKIKRVRTIEIWEKRGQ